MCPMKIEDPDSGEEKEVFTPEELEAERKKVQEEYEVKLADKDKHMQEKLDEFQKGKQSAELEKESFKSDIEKVKKIAEEAKDETAKERAKRIEIEKNKLIEDYVGNDIELKKKLEDAMESIDKTKVVELPDQVKMAASIAGINTVSTTLGGTHSMSGGYAPDFINRERKLSDSEHKQFKDALGLEDFSEKKE